MPKDIAQHQKPNTKLSKADSGTYRANNTNTTYVMTNFIKMFMMSWTCLKP